VSRPNNHNRHAFRRWIPEIDFPHALSLSFPSPTAAPMLPQESEAAAARKKEEKWTESYKHHQIDILSSLLAEDCRCLRDRTWIQHCVHYSDGRPSDHVAFPDIISFLPNFARIAFQQPLPSSTVSFQCFVSVDVSELRGI